MTGSSHFKCFMEQYSTLCVSQMAMVEFKLLLIIWHAPQHCQCKNYFTVMHVYMPFIWMIILSIIQFFTTVLWVVSHILAVFSLLYKIWSPHLCTKLLILVLDAIHYCISTEGMQSKMSVNAGSCTRHFKCIKDPSLHAIAAVIHST